MSWQRAVLDFADPYDVALAIVRNALTASADPVVAGVATVRAIPTPKPARLVQLRLDGGALDRGMTDTPLVTYRTWHDTDKKAAQLAALVRAAFLAAPSTVAGTKVRDVRDIVRPLDVPDPDDESVTTYFGRIELHLRA